jgi:hypothetical protein
MEFRYSLTVYMNFQIVVSHSERGGGWWKVGGGGWWRLISNDDESAFCLQCEAQADTV